MVIDQVLEAAMQFYESCQEEPNGRYRSWEHCYRAFCQAREQEVPDIDYLSLQLAFYLASWGMYRGSSFLLQRDYTVHQPVVEELLKPTYDSLVGLNAQSFCDPLVQQNLTNLYHFLQTYYGQVRQVVKKNSPKQAVSDTLLTKLLLGTLGCVPAYDRFFCKGVRYLQVAKGSYGVQSLMELASFYEKYQRQFEAFSQNMVISGYPYPPMKVLDMGFWQIGYELDQSS